MYRVIRSRDAGKTKELLKECANNNGLFVCRHPNSIQDKCMAYGIPFVKAIGFEDLRNLSDIEKSENRIYIDELELFVQQEFPSLQGYVISVDD